MDWCGWAERLLHTYGDNNDKKWRIVSMAVIGGLDA
jgi:hypothetical protein